MPTVHAVSLSGTDSRKDKEAQDEAQAVSVCIDSVLKRCESLATACVRRVVLAYANAFYAEHHRSKVVDLEQLCVVAGKIVWSLYVELTCLDDDGAQLDACLLATIAALQNGMACVRWCVPVWQYETVVLCGQAARLPVVHVDQDSGTAVPSASGTIPVRLNSIPVALSFGVFKRYAHVKTGSCGVY